MGFNVLEKMQNLDTLDDIVKVSDPFLEYMSAKFYNADFSFLDEFDDLKKVVDRLQAELNKVNEECRPVWDAIAALVNEMTELYKMIDDRDKFKNLLESETALNDIQKDKIWVEWERHRIRGTKVVKCLVCSKQVVNCYLGSEAIEECLKRKSVEVSEARPKAQLLEPRMVLSCMSFGRATEVKQMIQSYIDEWGFAPPPYLSSPPASPPYLSPPASPTNKRVGDNIGSSSSPH